MKALETFLKPTQSQLFNQLHKLYRDKAICSKGNYLLVQGEVPVLLVAHLDTVHEKPVRTICTSQQGNILMSPQGVGGDDRCGVYALVNAYEMSDSKPWLLFTCDEETGGKGARAFADDYEDGKLPNTLGLMKMILEVDRRGHQDAVYYDCGNEEFEAYIASKGFQTEYGTFSDISVIAPVIGVAAVNLSAGYYNAHTLHEFIDRRHINATLEKVVEIIEEASQEDFPQYEYVEAFWDLLDYYGNIGLPKNLPGKFKDVYDALLDFYHPKELDSYRKTYGNSVLNELYAAVYGGC